MHGSRVHPVRFWLCGKWLGVPSLRDGAIVPAPGREIERMGGERLLALLAGFNWDMCQNGGHDLDSRIGCLFSFFGHDP